MKPADRSPSTAPPAAPPLAPPPEQQVARPLWPATLAALLALLAWDATGLDATVAAWMGSAQGFALREHWLLTRVLHDGARIAAFLLLAGTLWSVWRPFSVFRWTGRRERVWLVAVAITGMLLVSLLKRASLTSCPWDLQSFGGAAQHVSHWAWGRGDGGPGRCFPAGHASAGFAWVAGFFAWRARAPAIAARWLAAALLAGLVLGISQQLRGAHFMSHTLWTGWLCWAWAWACSPLLRGRRDATAAG